MTPIAADVPPGRRAALCRPALVLLWVATLLIVPATMPDASARGAGTGRLRVTIIGIDGATWRVLDSLLARGDVPNFAQIIESGVRAPLRSRIPLFSAAVWTTVATGVIRERHGITDFDTPDGRLSASTDRKFPALWTTASGAGLRSAVVGWWVTYPAEAIDGVIISERALKTRDADMRELGGYPARGELPRLFHPPDASALMVDLGDLSEEFSGDDERAVVVARMRAEDAVVVRLLKRLRGRGKPFDLEMVLLRGVDPVSHHFWKYYEPHAPAYEEAERPSPSEVARYRSTIEDYYRYVDSLLGDLREPVTADHVLMLLSDHGFEAGKQPFRGSVLSGTHETKAALHGIFVASGGPIAPGRRLERVTILDIAPTVLHLLGVPVFENQDGRVLTEILEPGWAAAHRVRTLPTYTGPAVALPTHPDFVGATSPVDEELREQLRALGYIE